MQRRAVRSGCVSWLLAGVAVALMSSWSLPALGSEARADLDLGLRLVDVTATEPTEDGGASGTARIEAILRVALPTRGIRVRILRPDGTQWIAGGLPFDPGQPAWTRLDGSELLEGEDGLPSLGAREAIGTVLEVPLEGAAVHEIVVEVVGSGASGSIRTENMIRAALVVPLSDMEEDGTHVFFPLEVRP